MSTWPPSLWRSPWLCDLDATARAAIVAAGRLRSLESGERVFAVGQPADAFFVVASGLVEVRAIRRGETEATAIRRAVVGDAIGEEAVVRAGVLRATEAACVTPAVVAEVPVSVFRRVADRTDTAARTREVMQRLHVASALDTLRTSSLARVASDRALAELAVATHRRELSRDEVLFAEGDPAANAFVVEDGMLKVETGDDGRAQICAYLGKGDLVADGGLESGSAHEVTVRACGAACVLALPRVALLAAAGGRMEVLGRERRLTTSTAMPMATRHVLGDLWRFAVAGSMLVIDDDVCVRCGHCAWACATAHDDGVSRLVRRGEKVAVRDATDGSLRALVVPGGCQQCKHPACMPVCPTGAIGRDPRGQVFVREDLCVGCGQCERACPWGSVQMAPRPGRAKSSLPVLRPSEEGESRPAVPTSTGLVAVKCDACRDIDGGPACVRACPVDAIARVEPLASMVDVRRAVAERAPRRSLPRPRPAWPWVLGAAALAAAVARAPVVSWEERLATGLAAGVLVAALAGYAVVKRVVLPRLARRSTARPYAIAHLATGVLAIGVVAAHAGAHIRANAAGALLVAFAAASVTGVLAAVVYRLLPRALGRVEREARMPEDLAARSRDLDERAFGALTGRSDATKAVYARMLAPYARAPLGPLWLVLSRRTLGAEEAHLRTRLDRVLGRRAARLDGLDDLIRLVVERRAVGAQRALQGLLRSWVPVHVVSVAVAVVLLCVHVACVVGLR